MLEILIIYSCVNLIEAIYLWLHSFLFRDMILVFGFDNYYLFFYFGLGVSVISIRNIDARYVDIYSAFFRVSDISIEHFNSLYNDIYFACQTPLPLPQSCESCLWHTFDVELF